MDGILSFRRCKMSLPSPLQFHVVLALSTTEDSERPSLLVKLHYKVMIMVLAAKVYRDLRIKSSKVIMLASKGCNKNQENPRLVNFKKEQLNIKEQIY